jgi:hypothetical protein
MAGRRTLLPIQQRCKFILVGLAPTSPIYHPMKIAIWGKMSSVNIKNLSNIVNRKRGAHLKLIHNPTQGTTSPSHPHSAEKISIHLRSLRPYNAARHVPAKA